MKHFSKIWRSDAVRYLSDLVLPDLLFIPLTRLKPSNLHGVFRQIVGMRRFDFAKKWLEIPIFRAFFWVKIDRCSPKTVRLLV